MNTFALMCYLVLDELKLTSDDALYNEDHVLYLLNKYRAFILKLRYSDDIKKAVPESNYQSFTLSTLTEVPAIPVEYDDLGAWLGKIFYKSATTVPVTLKCSNSRIYALAPSTPPEGSSETSTRITSYFPKLEITIVSRDRFVFVGENKYLKNIVYASLLPDGYYYFRTANNLYFSKLVATNSRVILYGVFEDAIEALGDTDDVLSATFPIEDALVPPIIELVVKELRLSIYNPEDVLNNAEDDLSLVLVKSNSK